MQLVASERSSSRPRRQLQYCPERNSSPTI
jgi:hypothetical protein